MRTTRTRFALFILLCIVLSATLALCVERGEEAEMPHGQRDWSNIGASEVVHGLADTAELAARMGSPDVFNREGNVLLMQTFEHGSSGWLPTLGGVNASVRVSAEQYRTSGYSYRFDSGTGVLHYALASYLFPYPAIGKFGVELSFSCDDEATLLDPELWVYDGETLYLYGLRYDTVNNRMQKRTGDSSWATIIENIVLYTNPRIWNYVKLVCDLNTGYFSRIIINEQEHDISDELAYVVGMPATPRMDFRFTVRGSSGTAGIAYLDDLIITRGEP